VRKNKLKEKLESGQLALGAALGFNSPDTIELLGVLGIDYVTLDMEHEPFDELSMLHAIRAAESAGVTPIARLQNDPDLILRVLDAGAQGIHVPRINEAEAAEDAVSSARFYPEGDRSFFATARSGDYGIGVTEEEYASTANAETLVTVQIEEEEGVENLAEILAVPGIDIIQVGPKDLWQSMGMPDRDEVTKVVDHVIGSAVASGKWVSSYVWLNESFEQQVERLTGLGVQMLTASARDFIVEGARGFLALGEKFNGRKR
jgi:4-hydroxy-2-oxoheptanedioate aldolase